VIDGLVARVGTFIARERLLRPRQPVLALASGGADSTLLVHALVRLGFDVSVLHVAHALRGEESERDAAAVLALAEQLGVPCSRSEAPLADGADLERRARDLRRAAADALADGRTIATGHTRDDRVETILYRLASSPGGSAFRALPPSDGAGRVRPLLELGREEVREALAASGIPWRDDSANDDRRFARVRTRLDLLPAFRSLHPAAEQNLLRTAAQLVDQHAVLDEAAGALLVETARRSTRARPLLRPPSSHALRCGASRGRRRRRPPVSSARSSSAIVVPAPGACRWAPGASPSVATGSCG